MSFTNSTSTVRLQLHEGELQHLPGPAQSPDLKITEPLWSVLETRVRYRFPLPTSVKQFEDVLQEEWFQIPLEQLFWPPELPDLNFIEPLVSFGD
jgi:hypothetical protein